MAKNGKDTKHTRHIARRIHFVRNGEEYKMRKIYWCEGGLQLAEIGTKNVSEPDLTPRIKYIIVRLENWYRTLVQEGWQNKGYYMEQELCITCNHYIFLHATVKVAYYFFLYSLQLLPDYRRRVSIRVYYLGFPTRDYSDRISNEIPFVNSFSIFLPAIIF